MLIYRSMPLLIVSLSLCFFLCFTPSASLVESFILKHNHQSVKQIESSLLSLGATTARGRKYGIDKHRRQRNQIMKLSHFSFTLLSSSSSSQDFEDFSQKEEENEFSSKFLYESLKNRQNALEKGIGKRYICRTIKGFLNVHREPGDPFRTDNIVNQLIEGQVVTSMGQQQELAFGDDIWIQHDEGGWSISTHSGFTFLEQIEE